MSAVHTELFADSNVGFTGVEIFNKVVKKHMDGSGVEVDYQITEKEGYNSLEEIVKRLDLDNYDALLVVGGDSSLRDVINGIWEKQGKPDPKVIQIVCCSKASKTKHQPNFQKCVTFIVISLSDRYNLDSAFVPK